MPLDAAEGKRARTEKAIPEKYAVTAEFAALRVMERMGITIAEWDGLNHGRRALLLAYDRVRRQEECRERV